MIYLFVQPPVLEIVSVPLRIYASVRKDGLVRFVMLRCAQTQSATRIRCVILQTIVFANLDSQEKIVKVMSYKINDIK